MSVMRMLLGGGAVDVLSPRDVIVEGPPVEVPQVGLRWGQPSQFEFGQPAALVPPERPAIIIRRGEARIFKGVETFRQYPEHFPKLQRVEGIRNATFYLGPRVEERETRKVVGGATVVQPLIETIHEYIEFAFDFVVVGERGEDPPAQEAPPRLSPQIVEAAAIDLGPWRTIVRLETPEDSSGEYIVWILTWEADSTAWDGPNFSTEAEALAAAQSQIDANWAAIRASWVAMANFVDVQNPVAYAKYRSGSGSEWWEAFILARFTVQEDAALASDYEFPPTSDLLAYRDLFGGLTSNIWFDVPSPGIFGDGMEPLHNTVITSVEPGDPIGG